mgnify:CR=1 FL=1
MVLKYSNNIITLLLLCFVAVMMTPRGNLAPWSFNNGKGLSQIESFTELLKTEKRAFDSKNVFAFDPDWEDVSPFIKVKDGFSLKVNIGGNTRIVFPPVLNSRSPIKIRTRNKTVKQYLSSGGTYRGELVGRYLVYRGKGRDILYRYDTDSNELREFVYVPTKDSLDTDGEVIRWRFEGVNLSLEHNGNVRLIHSRNPAKKLAQIADNGMQSRISRFLDKRNQPLSKEPIEKTLFVIPRPDYIDGNFKTLTKGIRYEVSNNELKLKLNIDMDFRFPLWVDPTLTADADADFTEKLLGSIGIVYQVKESLLDTVTGLSGSGPAYVYTFIEALADGALLEGLPRDQALALATQTVLGAARMVADSGEHPSVLRDRVTSPGGTTIAGLAALEEGAFRSSAINAVKAATKKARELGR